MARYTQGTDLGDFLAVMITEHLDDESLPQAVAAFLRDHPDSQSAEDFASWCCDSEDEESASRKMADNVEASNSVAEWIADGEMSEFAEFAEAEFGILIYC